MNTKNATKIEAGETLVFTFNSEIDSTVIADLEAEFAGIFTPGTADEGFTVASSTNASGNTVVTVTAEPSFVAADIETFNTTGTITISKANLKDKATGNIPANNLVIDFK